MKTANLFVCPTPIGNLEDISLRTLKVLEKVDLIAAEDTRHTRKLLNHYNIKNSLTSYHEHNEREKGEKLIEKLKEGKNIALVSDAGMPGISDPGEKLIRLAIEADIKVVVLPGPTAAITALVASGLATDKFAFEGFLSSRKGDRRKELEKIKNEERTLIFYESPYRLLDSLKDMLNILGDRQVAIARELTKLYEEFFRGQLSQAIKKFQADQIRGEFVIVVEGTSKEEKDIVIDIEKKLKKYLDKGYTKKDSIRLVAEKYGLPRNQVYKESLKI
ncbi:MAG TPA: 16S rRNA (cytidine(1402)-2'-O)-methyltransferase [Tissierellaceae bacterium]|nr:16S rRNA (cytidine(1402)-2'-O)-methyltransferase [Tissierellaceae bacterium]